MRKLAFLLGLLSALPLAAQQTQTSFTITVNAPPSCVVKLLPNAVSSSGASIYSGQAGVINFDISGCSIASSSASATWDGAVASVTYTAAVAPNPAKLVANITAAQATVGSHALVLTIPWPLMTMNQDTTLPNFTPGQPYSANLAALARLSGGVPPYRFSLTSGALPSGLSLSSSGIVSGTTSSTGSFSFSFTIADSSGLALVFRVGGIAS